MVLHAFTDGRDTLPESGAGYLAEAEEWLAAGGRPRGHGDRPLLRDGPRQPLGPHRAGARRPRAWRGRGPPRTDRARRRRGTSYARGETDEFVRPTLVGEEGRIRDGDAVLFFNFRPDRARQLTPALGEQADVHLTTLTSYREEWELPVAFPPERPATTLAQVLADRGIGQLHVAETEKYAHVTYFLNGGEEEPHDGEERCLVDSPRDVPTYDHKPEMSARAAADAFLDRWARRRLRLRHHQLRQPGHGRPHGGDPRGGEGRRDRGRVPGRVVEAVHAGGRRVRRHGRPWQRRPHAGAGRQPQHRPLAEPGAADRDRRDGGPCATAGSWPTWLQRCSRCSRIEQPAAMTGTSLF